MNAYIQIQILAAAFGLLSLFFFFVFKQILTHSPTNVEKIFYIFFYIKIHICRETNKKIVTKIRQNIPEKKNKPS